LLVWKGLFCIIGQAAESLADFFFDISHQAPVDYLDLSKGEATRTLNNQNMETTRRETSFVRGLHRRNEEIGARSAVPAKQILPATSENVLLVSSGHDSRARAARKRPSSQNLRKAESAIKPAMSQSRRIGGRISFASSICFAFRARRIAYVRPELSLCSSAVAYDSVSANEKKVKTWSS
jgi:hypothetical protein